MNAADNYKLNRVVSIFLPVDWGKALARAALWWVMALMLAALTIPIYSSLQWTPVILSRRLVDYSIGIIASPIPIAAMVLGIRAFLGTIFALWPGKLQIDVDEERLQLNLGPFGTHTYPTAELDVRYPFECIGEAGEPPFEALLPQEKQLAEFVPRINHPTAKSSIRDLLLRYARGNEEEIAAELRPLFCHKRPDLFDGTEE